MCSLQILLPRLASRCNQDKSLCHELAKWLFLCLLPGRRISHTYYCRWHVGFNGCRAGFYPLSLSVVDGHYLFFCWALSPVQDWFRLADWLHSPQSIILATILSTLSLPSPNSLPKYLIYHLISFIPLFFACSFVVVHSFVLHWRLHYNKWIALGSHSRILLTVKIYSRRFMPSSLIDHVYQVFAKFDLRKGGHVVNQVWSKSRYAQSCSNSSSCQSIKLQVSSPWQHQLLPWTRHLAAATACLTFVVFQNRLGPCPKRICFNVLPNLIMYSIMNCSHRCRYGAS